MTRKRIPHREELAAALRELAVLRGGALEHALTYEEAKLMTADQVISLFQRDHGIHHTIGGPDEHWNLTWRFIGEHREKTNKIDKPRIAKTRRGAKAEAQFRQRVLARSGQADADEGIPSRDKIRTSRWPKGRKMQSRPFPKRSAQ